MFRHTGKLLEKFDADFMISGEVLGQRPMSQRKEALENVKKLSEQDDLIVRPLSAKLMAPSKPEREGWIDREKLLDIEGRNRQRQIELASKIGLEDFESPGGGCLLTEIQFSAKLRDFADHDNMEIEDIDTLKAGRHLRLPDGAKLIIGRNQEDNEKIKNTQSKKYFKAQIVDASGPLCLLQKDATQDDKDLAANLIITYGRTNLDQQYKVKLFTNDSDEISYLAGEKLPSKETIAQYFIQ
jgi:tRNA-specific 2-thiouridylase